VGADHAPDAAFLERPDDLCPCNRSAGSRQSRRQFVGLSPRQIAAKGWHDPSVTNPEGWGRSATAIRYCTIVLVLHLRHPSRRQRRSRVSRWRNSTRIGFISRIKVGRSNSPRSNWCQRWKARSLANFSIAPWVPVHPCLLRKLGRLRIAPALQHAFKVASDVAVA